MKLIARTLAVAVALAPALALANDKDADQQPMTDARMASMLHQVNQMEIKAGELARKQGSSQGVKDFGKMLVDDHRKADQKLTSLAKKEKLGLGALDKADKEKLRVDREKMDQVKKMHGPEFDRSFAGVMFHGHDDVLNMLSKHESDLKSAGLKQFVDDTRPGLERHRDMADKLQGQGAAQGRSSGSEMHRRSMDTSGADRSGTNPQGDTAKRAGERQKPAPR